MSTATAYKLQDAGFTRAQVEALGELVSSESATKSDLIASTSELKLVAAGQTREIAALEARQNSRMDQLQAELVLHRWMLGVIVAGIVALFVRSFSLSGRRRRRTEAEGRCRP